MPLLPKGTLKIDYADEGQGEVVILVHSSVSGNRQWRAMSEALRDRYRVLAINLYGYGDTTPWSIAPVHRLQELTLARLPTSVDAAVCANVCSEEWGPVHRRLNTVCYTLHPVVASVGCRARGSQEMAERAR